MMTFKPFYKKHFAAAIFLLITSAAIAQEPAYFIDGYHGGIWGHYPEWNTRFMTDQLKAHPEWKINLEIEPETWAVAKVKDPKAYEEFRALFADQKIGSRRIEYVSPAYGQSYLYTGSGESLIRQFSYGMEMIRQHFPTATFDTYSSEEPCFTSALPQILKSFGYKYASLKNPNTLWGGYMRAYGGELVNWIGPDGTRLITVPRYGIEALKPRSTWETIGNDNNIPYMTAAFKAGIQNPVGMTLQDAGWKNGPWLGKNDRGYQPTFYKTWTDYVDNFSIKTPKEDRKFGQQDVLTSLVWGSQVLQRIAQQVRVSENKLVVAEKMAALARVYKNASWPKAALDEAWTRLLLSQHHDCWIVPYNGRPGDTWADKVVRWTGVTNKNTDSVVLASAALLSQASSGDQQFVRVFNTTATKRSEMVKVALPANWSRAVKVVDGEGREVASQIDGATLWFRATVPSIGYDTYKIVAQTATPGKGTKVTHIKGKYRVETDLYTAVIDPARGGTIESLIAKNLGNKEFVNKPNERRFNELRGNFFKDGGFRSSADQPAEVSIVERGAVRITLQVKGNIAGNPFTQLITFTQGEKRIDMHLTINWQGNPKIGNPYGQDKYDALSLKKGFYDDRDKLLTLFPLNLKGQKVYVNAPYDVTESKLDNTFFDSWDSIKNNVVLNWVDVTDASNTYGMAMLTDHTTNYAHGKDHPLGLTTAYSGVGLWGRNYSIKNATELSYALIPHAGKWEKSGVWAESVNFNEPMLTTIMTSVPAADDMKKCLIDVIGTGFEISSITFDGDDLLVRLFNAGGDDQPKTLVLDAIADKAEIVALNGKIEKSLSINKSSAFSKISLAMPRFGIRSVKFHHIRR